jgi:hypothetical protein
MCPLQYLQEARPEQPQVHMPSGYMQGHAIAASLLDALLVLGKPHVTQGEPYACW